MAGTIPTRPYRSPVREDRSRATRARVLAAAATEFLDVGYAATTVRAVARRAGVSVATVEQAFGTKPRLLKLAIAYAIRGDAAQAPMLEREWAHRAAAVPELDGFLALVAGQLIESAARSAGLVAAALEGANQDETLEVLAAELRSQRRQTAAWIIDGVMARAPLRPGLDRESATDTVWLLMDPRTFIEATRQRGWSPAEFGRWFAAALARLLTPIKETP